MAKRKAANKEDQAPRTLSFRRAVEISDALLYSLSDSKSKTPIKSYGHGMRTTAAYDTEAGDKGDATEKRDDSRNLTYVEKAKLPPDSNKLLIEFDIRILPIAEKPELCDNVLVAQNCETAISGLKKPDNENLRAIASYYAYNILNGSWGWRNRDCADSASIAISYCGKKQTVENALDWGLRPVLFRSGAEKSVKDPVEEKATEIAELAGAIKDAFCGQSALLTIHCEGIFTMVKGAEVWPSQMYCPVPEKIGKQEIGRKLFTKEGCVVITAEKIGNALRTYDAWHAGEYGEVIAIDPNGSSLRVSKTLRLEKHGNRLWDILPRFYDGETLTDEEQRFVIGCLIRGAVLGKKKEKNDDEEEKKKKRNAPGETPEGAPEPMIEESGHETN